MALPADSQFALRTKSKQEEDKLEMMHLKKLVLSYEEREEREMISSMMNEDQQQSKRLDESLLNTIPGFAPARGRGRGHGTSSTRWRGRGGSSLYQPRVIFSDR